MGNPLTTILRPCLAELQVDGRWVACQRTLEHDGWHAWSSATIGVSWSDR